MMNYDALADDYARHRRVHPEVLRRLLDGVSRTTRALEVGSGTGNYIIALQSTTGCAAWGIDPSEQMLAQARLRGSQAQFAPGRAEQLDFADGSFDLVFSVDVIHHVQDRAACFGQAHRVLAPGRRMCTVTDSEWIIRNRAPLSRYFPETVEPELARYPRLEGLRTLMGGAGFEYIAEETVEFRYELTDIQAYRDRAYSSLYLIPGEAFRRGIEAMEGDLRAGPIPCVSRYVLVWGSKV